MLKKLCIFVTVLQVYEKNFPLLDALWNVSDIKALGFVRANRFFWSKVMYPPDEDIIGFTKISGITKMLFHEIK